MTHFEHVHAPNRACGQCRLDDRRFRVPCEQHALGSLSGHHHDARLVGSGVDDRISRRDHVKLYRADAQAIPGAQLLEPSGTGISSHCLHRT